ncbi:MAG: hypothetical protein AB8G11_07980 [Saprospiraceae bacterium]
MKNQQQLHFLSVLAVILVCSTSAFGNKVASLTTSINGGIEGTEDSFTPYISFKGDEALFSTKVVTATDEGVTFILASDFDDINFATFIEKLTDDQDDNLSIGHKIGKIKSDVSNLESKWFDGLTFEGKNISFITLTYSNIKFEGEENGEWTDFSYDLTLSVFDDDDIDGIDLADHDNDIDGIDFAYVDYETLEQMEGLTMTKGGTTTKGLSIEKTDDGLFIISEASKENKEDSEEIRKIAVKIMYISTAGAAKGTD